MSIFCTHTVKFRLYKCMCMNYVSGWKHLCVFVCKCMCMCAAGAAAYASMITCPAVISQIAEDSLAKVWPCHSYSLP